MAAIDGAKLVEQACKELDVDLDKITRLPRGEVEEEATEAYDEAEDEFLAKRASSGPTTPTEQRQIALNAVEKLLERLQERAHER